MRSKILAIVVLGSVAAGCGNDELFDVQLKDNEVAIGSAAAASVHSNTVTFDQVYVVGDLDGDGIDDAMVRPLMVADQNLTPDSVYILYGANGLTGEISLDDLPSLTGVGWGGVGEGIVPVGDIDGDGLADVLVTGFTDVVCEQETGEITHSGVFIIYGSATRLTGATPAVDAGAYLRNSVACSGTSAQPWLGDLDGDGKADFAIGSYDPSDGPHMRLYYGRSARLTGVVDVATPGDADLTPVTTDAEFSLYGVGDIDGDGHGELFAMSALAGDPVDLRLVHGSATRLAGTVAVDAIARSRFSGDALVDRGAISAPVAPLGDLDGDGLADFALLGSAPFGQLIFYGRRDGFPAQVDPTMADALLLATGTQINPVTKIATGDVYGDGTRDVVMTDAGFNHDDGAVYLLHGGQARLAGMIDPSTDGRVYVGTRQRFDECDNTSEMDCLAHERVGTYLGLGDLRGEGHPSLLVSAPWYNFLDAVGDGKFGTISQAYIVSPKL